MKIYEILRQNVQKMFRMSPRRIEQRELGETIVNKNNNRIFQS